MAVELSLVKCFCDSRESWQRYDPYIRNLKNMDRDIRLLFTAVRGYYDKYDKDTISHDDFKTFYEYSNPTGKNKQFQMELIDTLFQMDINTDLAEDMFEKLMERHEANRIVNQLIPVVEGTKWGMLSDIKTQIEEFERRMKHPPQDLMSLEPSRTNIQELIALEINPKGLSWPLHTLNEAIGVLRRKTFGVEFAYSDTGKTSFATKCVAHWARQLKPEERIVYAGNEEAARRTELRITQALTGWTADQIASDGFGAEKLRNERGWDKIFIYDGVTSTDYLRALAEEYMPHVMVSDQFTKVDIKLPSNASDIKILEKLSNWFREFAKEYDLAMMGLTQGRGETAGKKFLTLSDIYNSRVAVQGELDWAIGIGSTEEQGKEMVRYFSIPKNKFGDHTKFQTMFNHLNNSWTEI